MDRGAWWAEPRVRHEVTMHIEIKIVKFAHTLKLTQ